MIQRKTIRQTAAALAAIVAPCSGFSLAANGKFTDYRRIPTAAQIAHFYAQHPTGTVILHAMSQRNRSSSEAVIRQEQSA